MKCDSKGIFFAILRYARLCAVLGTMAAVAACASPRGPTQDAPVAAGQSVLRGWQQCTDDHCGKNFISAYSRFVFLRVDDSSQAESAAVTAMPGRHWVEAHYAWGAGFITGIGNWRNYGFEIDLQPGHTYLIEEAPAGCVVPATRHWVSPKTLRVIDVAPSGERMARDIRAMEYCTPTSREVGSCRQDRDCRTGTCTPFGGTTGYGLCGALR